MYIRFLKRLFDIVSSAFIIVLVFPLVLIFAIIIAFESKGPVFFTQDRLGKGGRVFTLYKLRSMKVNSGRIEVQVRNDHPDITGTGKFIRRFKIDELPQLMNVLKGDMSLIGPRPCLPFLKEKFDENGHYRLKVRPGLTGWAQINGNINNPWPVRWQLDRFYVENQSFLLDLKILFRTFQVVIFGE